MIKSVGNKKHIMLVYALIIIDNWIVVLRRVNELTRNPTLCSLSAPCPEAYCIWSCPMRVYILSCSSPAYTASASPSLKAPLSLHIDYADIIVFLVLKIIAEKSDN